MGQFVNVILTLGERAYQDVGLAHLMHEEFSVEVLIHFFQDSIDYPGLLAGLEGGAGLPQLGCKLALVM